MRFLIVRHADADTEAGLLASPALDDALAAYHEGLAQAGALVARYALAAPSAGAFYRHADGGTTLAASADPLAAGATVVEARSLDAAVDWARQWPAQDAEATLTVLPAPPPTVTTARPDGRARFLALHARPPSAGKPGPAQQQALAQCLADAASAGALLDTSGLGGTGDGVRVKHTNGDPSLVPGPSGEADVVSGFALYQAASLADLQVWAERVGGILGDGASEIRPVVDA